MIEPPDRITKSLALRYGLRVGAVGEDGDMLALGHHPTLRTVAALNAEARYLMGPMGLAENCWPYRFIYGEVASKLKRTWAVLRETCDYADLEEGHDPPSDPCYECKLRREVDWYIEWGHTPHHYRAFPIMLWSA